MVTVLDSGQRELVYSACGVLINVLADSAYHDSVARLGGVRKWVVCVCAPACVCVCVSSAKEFVSSEVWTGVQAVQELFLVRDMLFLHCTSLREHVNISGPCFVPCTVTPFAPSHSLLWVVLPAWSLFLSMCRQVVLAIDVWSNWWLLINLLVLVSLIVD